MKKYICLALFMLPLSIFAQTMLQGKISLKDATDTFTETGVSIYWEDTTRGTTTDANGHFKLLYKPELKKLVVSYVGFKTKVLTITDPMKFVNAILQEDTNQLEAVEVTVAKRKPTERLQLSTAGMVNINSGELLKAACCNLSDSFETSSNTEVAVADAVTGTKQIKMLGLASPYLSLTQENVPSIRGASQVYGLTFIPGSWVDNIQLIKGAGSVINGYESIAGQINTELVKPILDTPIYLNVYGSEDGRFELNNHLNTKVTDHWYTGLYIHGNARNMQMDNNGDGFMDVPTGSQINLMNRWQYANPNTGWMSNLSLHYLYDDRKAGQLSSLAIPSLWQSTNKIHQFNTSAKLGYIWEDMPYQSLGFQADYKQYDQDARFGLNDYAISQKTLYVNALFKSIIGNTNHTFTTGINSITDVIDERVGVSSLSGDYDRTDFSAGAFFEYSLSAGDTFGLTAGARADYHNHIGAFITPRFHLRYMPWKKGTLRFAVGRGERLASIFSENQKLFSTARTIRLMSSEADKTYGLSPEIAWNYGLSFTQNLPLRGRDLELVADLYYTNFTNQVVVDWDNPREVAFYNLTGKSFSTNFQIEANYEILKRTHLKVAYKWFDVQTDYLSGRRIQPFQPKERWMVNLSYETTPQEGRQWRFDTTFNAVGSQRLPDTSSNPQAYQMGDTAAAYTTTQAQLTRVFSPMIEVYLGAENLFNYYQKRAIIASDAPFGTYFDASMAYAPVQGRMIYAGLRFKLK